MTVQPKTKKKPSAPEPSGPVPVERTENNAYGAPAGPVAFVSTIKLRRAGFNAAVDTQEAFSAALQSFIDRKLLPPAHA